MIALTQLQRNHQRLQSQVLTAHNTLVAQCNSEYRLPCGAHRISYVLPRKDAIYLFRWSITRRFLPEICIALEAVLLKLHTKLAPGWALIWVNLNPIQEIEPKEGVGALLWVGPFSQDYGTLKPSSPVARQVAPSKTGLQSRDSHAYSSVLREELLAHGSAMRMCHLSIMLLIEFADADTAQKVHYQPNTNNRSNNQCITLMLSLQH